MISGFYVNNLITWIRTNESKWFWLLLMKKIFAWNWASGDNLRNRQIQLAVKKVKAPWEVLGITTLTSFLQLTRYVPILCSMFFPYLPLDLTTSTGRQEIYQPVEPYTFGDIKWVICHESGCTGCLSYDVCGERSWFLEELDTGVHLKLQLQTIVLFGILHFLSWNDCCLYRTPTGLTSGHAILLLQHVLWPVINTQKCISFLRRYTAHCWAVMGSDRLKALSLWQSAINCREVLIFSRLERNRNPQEKASGG